MYVCMYVLFFRRLVDQYSIRHDERSRQQHFSKCWSTLDGRIDWQESWNMVGLWSALGM